MFTPMGLSVSDPRGLELAHEVLSCQARGRDHPETACIGYARGHPAQGDEPHGALRVSGNRTRGVQ
ncbi:MAG: hypothetical protein MZV70_39105 [Desulfobacterales bacterium]|nr:hypothetical protein [Desulfobacterales bacterium]